MAEGEVKLGVILKGKMAEAFQEEVDKTMATNAAFARLLIEEGLRRRGHDVEDKVSWGGRRTPKDEQEGQPVGAGAG